MTIHQNDPVMMGLLKSTMFPLQQVLEGEKTTFVSILYQLVLQPAGALKLGNSFPVRIE